MRTGTLKNETLEIVRIIKAPIKEHLGLLANHFRRYDAAVHKLAISSKDYVIDASCGQGYGAYLLSLKAKKVFGLDVNNNYLNLAKQVFKVKNLNFYHYDLFDKLLSRHKVPKADKIVCVETIEHISKDKLEEFTEKLFTYLKANGEIFLTAPIGNNRPCNYNKFHLNKPSLDYLNRLFKPFFRKVIFETSEFKDSFGYKTTFCHATLRGFGDR